MSGWALLLDQGWEAKSGFSSSVIEVGSSSWSGALSPDWPWFQGAKWAGRGKSQGLQKRLLLWIRDEYKDVDGITELFRLEKAFKLFKSSLDGCRLGADALGGGLSWLCCLFEHPLSCRGAAACEWRSEWRRAQTRAMRAVKVTFQCTQTKRVHPSSPADERPDKILTHLWCFSLGD